MRRHFCDRVAMPQMLPAFAALLILSWTSTGGEQLQPAERCRIAVLGFKNLRANDEANDWIAALAADTLATKLTGVRAFLVVDRQQIDKLAKEQRLQQSDLVDPEKTVRIGKFLGAQSVVLGSMAVAGKQVQLNARIVDVETGEVLNAAVLTGNIDDIFNLTVKLGDAVIESLAKKVVVVAGAKVVDEVQTKPALSNEEKQQLAEQPTANSGAFKAYGESIALMQKSRFREAIVKVEEAVRLDAAYAQAWQLKGKLHHLLGESAEAYKAYAKAEALFRERHDEDSLAETLSVAGEVIAAEGDHQAALQTFSRARAIYEQRGNQLGLAQVLISEGDVWQRLTRWEEARACYTRSLAMQRQAGIESETSRTYNNLGLVDYNTGNRAAAFANFEASRQGYEKVGNEIGLATALGNLGMVYADEGKSAEAFAHYTRALEIHRRLGLQAEAARNLNNIGLLYTTQGDLDKALQFYNESLAISRRTGLRSAVGLTLNNAGEVLLKQDKPLEALRAFEEAAKVHQEAGDQLSLAKSLGNLTDLYLKFNRQDDALRALLILEPILRQTNNPAALAPILLYIAGLYSDCKQDYNTAYKYAQEASRLAHEANIPNADEYKKIERQIKRGVR